MSAAAYYMIAGATMEHVGSRLRASTWPAPMWVTYLAGALAGLVWPLLLAAWLCWTAGKARSR